MALRVAASRVALLALAGLPCAIAIANGLALTPPMGVNTYNGHITPDAVHLKQLGDDLVRLGLAAKVRNASRRARAHEIVRFGSAGNCCPLKHASATAATLIAECSILRVR